MATEIETHFALSSALYFPFEATFDEEGENCARDVAALLETLKAGIEHLMEGVLGGEATAKLRAAGLLDDLVLVTGIEAGSVTIKGLFKGSLIFLAGATFSPAWEDSDPGRIIIPQVTQAINSAYSAGVDLAQTGAEALARQAAVQPVGAPLGSFRIDTVEIVDGVMKIRLVRTGSSSRSLRGGGNFRL